MANGSGDVRKFINWGWERVNQHPLQRIEKTLATMKAQPPRKVKPLIPAKMQPPAAPPRQRFKRYGPAMPASRRKGLQGLKSALTKAK